MDDRSEKVKALIRKRSRKPKSLNFVGWGSKNLINFLKSLGRDTTEKISEYEVTKIVRKYIRDVNVPSKTATTKTAVPCDELNVSAANPKKKKKKKKKKKTKIVPCDENLSSLFGSDKVNTTKLYDLVAMHYAENQEEEEEDEDVNYYLYSSEEDDKVVVKKKKAKGSVAAIVRDNVKLVYLRKSLVMELAKKSETFVGRVVGSFVRIKYPCQLVQVTGTI